MKVLLLAVLILLSGCSTMRTANGKFYIGPTEYNPLITNDRNCHDRTSCVVLKGHKIEYRIFINF